MDAMHSKSERGIALISALLIMLLMSSLLAGFAAMVMSDSRLRNADQGRSRAFYAAHAGLEQLTSDIGTLFSTNFAPTNADINALMTTPPPLANVTWLQPDGTPGYQITFEDLDPVDGMPDNDIRTVISGPYQGFVGLITPYTLTATARLSDGSEASLTRQLQTVSIPVFQFGMFSETALSFFAGPDFNFGGRVHTNSDLYLTGKAILTMSDRVTAVGEVVRKYLSNGFNSSASYTGRVRILRAPGSYRDLGMNEGSVTGDVGSALNEPTWSNLSTGTYNHNIMNGRTGARRLELPIVSFGAQPIDLLKRPLPGEDVARPQVFGQRYFPQVGLRILLSDTIIDIMNLPGVTATPPVPLGNLATTPVPAYVGAPFAISGGPSGGTPPYLTPAGTPSLGGFLKIEQQDGAGTWTDVTLEILNLGIAGRNLQNGACGEPNPDAIIRLERLRDYATCENGSTDPLRYWPNVLYDAREGAYRDGTGTTVPYFSGAMHYVELDVRNLKRWIEGSIGATGANTRNLTGYAVYFSDRRGNRDAGGQETGEYGFEDVINPNVGDGSPNGVLDAGEDVNGNGILDVYGGTPQLPPGAMTSPFGPGARPNQTYNSVAQARQNPAIFFRRALKLVHGSLGNLPLPGLTVVSENPVYVEGHYNANAAGFGVPNAAAAVMADAVTVLSADWDERESWTYLHSVGNRRADTQTFYRFAIIGGKPLSFPRTNGGWPEDFGTDGGAHNFIRYLQDWNTTLNYRGAIATLATSRQAVGTYKCCATVYSPPTRGYNFDTNFLTPSLLPPLTPMFRDINSTGFSYVIRPQ